MGQSRRIALYGAAALVVGGLAWAGFIREVPPDASTRLSGAQMIARMGDFDGALAICDIVRDEHPDSLDERIFRAAFLAMAERHDEAIQVYRAAIDRAGELGEEAIRGDLLLDLGSLLLSRDRMEEFESVRAELARDPGDHRARFLDGLRAASEGDWEAAVGPIREAQERNSEDAGMRYRLWHALMSRGQQRMVGKRFAEAAEDFDGARRLMPTEISGFLRAAEAHRAMGDAETAQAILDDAAVLEPGTVADSLAASRESAGAASAVPE